MTATSPVFTPEALETAALGYQWRDNDRPRIAASSARAVAGAGLRRSRRLGIGDPGRHGALHALFSQRRPHRRRQATAFDNRVRGHDASGSFNDGKPAGAREPELAEAPQFYRQYGFGLFDVNDNGDAVVGHTGGVSGYTACMEMNLTRGFGAVAMANLVEAPLHPCAIVLYAMQVLRAQSLGQPLPEPPQAPDARVVERAEQYAGSFASPNGHRFTIVAANGQLSLNDGAENVAIYPRGDDTFWVDSKNYALSNSTSAAIATTASSKPTTVRTGTPAPVTAGRARFRIRRAGIR